MKKLLTLVLALTTLALVGCGGGADNAGAKSEKVVKVGASPVPHAEILEVVKPELAKEGIKLEMEEGDLEILKDNTVDFIGFSYYSSRLTGTLNQDGEKTSGNVFPTLKNPYLERSEWGWQIDPVGLRITMNAL